MDDEPVQVNGADEVVAYENPVATHVSKDDFWDYYHLKKASEGFTYEYAVRLGRKIRLY